MKAIRLLRRVLPCLGILAVSACATVPSELEGQFAEISPARVDPAAFGQHVRWGGVIVETRNEASRTCFEILSRQLGSHLRPLLEDRTAGRFIACKDGFFDPEVFGKGREVTLTGRIDRIEEHKIEDFTYRYPVVEVDQLVLWEQREDVVVYQDYYDPFWYPGYPYYWGSPYWGYWPYYRHPFGIGGSARVRKTLPGPVRTGPDSDD